MDFYGEKTGNAFAKVQSSSTAKTVGPGASVVKYDILTALLVTAAQSGGAIARLATRLALVITARFNWRFGHFSVGQRELARMWGVTERTAKREMAQMRSLGWISVERPAVRGRVAQYKIEFPTLLKSTMEHWDAVGPDFAARMTGTPELDETVSNVVPLHQKTESIPAEDGTDWPKVAELLQTHDAGLYTSWFSKLTILDTDDGCWTFLAPSRFVASYVDTHLRARLLVAIAKVDRSVRDVAVVAGDN